MRHSRIDSLLRKVNQLTADTIANLRRELRNIEEEKVRLTAGLDAAAQRIVATLQQLSGHSKDGTLRRGRPVGSVSTRGGAGKKRIRRSPEQLKKYADGVYQLIKSAGSQGAGGGEIRKQFPNVGQDIRAFIQKHGGYKVKTTGQKSFMRYHA